MTLRWDSASFCPLHFRGMDVLYVSFLAIPLPAYVVVAVELVLIADIRHRFFGTSWWLWALQVVGGGALVFVAALIFCNA